jgi:hypothetical protein
MGFNRNPGKMPSLRLRLPIAQQLLRQQKPSQTSSSGNKARPPKTTTRGLTRQQR